MSSAIAQSVLIVGFTALLPAQPIHAASMTPDNQEILETLTETRPGVYEGVDEFGNSIRVAKGRDGAREDLQILGSYLEHLRQKNGHRNTKDIFRLETTIDLLRDFAFSQSSKSWDATGTACSDAVFWRIEVSAHSTGASAEAWVTNSSAAVQEIKWAYTNALLNTSTFPATDSDTIPAGVVGSINPMSYVSSYPELQGYTSAYANAIATECDLFVSLTLRYPPD